MFSGLAPSQRLHAPVWVAIPILRRRILRANPHKVLMFATYGDAARLREVKEVFEFWGSAAIRNASGQQSFSKESSLIRTSRHIR